MSTGAFALDMRLYGLGCQNLDFFSVQENVHLFEIFAHKAHG